MNEQLFTLKDMEAMYYEGLSNGGEFRELYEFKECFDHLVHEHKIFPITQWVKTSDALPYNDGAYLVCYKDQVEILCFNRKDQCWDGPDGDDYECDLNEVKAWMHLPNYSI